MKPPLLGLDEMATSEICHADVHRLGASNGQEIYTGTCDFHLSSHDRHSEISADELRRLSLCQILDTPAIPTGNKFKLKNQ